MNKEKKSPAHLKKFLFPLMGGLVVVILGIWTVSDNNPLKPDNGENDQKFSTTIRKLWELCLHLQMPFLEEKIFVVLESE
jgi:hypothetical protein